MSNQSEERVSGLETKLSELSGVVGQYERLRYQVSKANQEVYSFWENFCFLDEISRYWRTEIFKKRYIIFENFYQWGVGLREHQLPPVYKNYASEIS